MSPESKVLLTCPPGLAQGRVLSKISPAVVVRLGQEQVGDSGHREGTCPQSLVRSSQNILELLGVCFTGKK